MKTTFQKTKKRRSFTLKSMLMRMLRRSIILTLFGLFMSVSVAQSALVSITIPAVVKVVF